MCKCYKLPCLSKFYWFVFWFFPWCLRFECLVGSCEFYEVTKKQMYRYQGIKQYAKLHIQRTKVLWWKSNEESILWSGDYGKYISDTCITYVISLPSCSSRPPNASFLQLSQRVSWSILEHLPWRDLLSTKTIRFRNPRNEGLCGVSWERHDGLALEWVARTCLYFNWVTFLCVVG